MMRRFYLFMCVMFLSVVGFSEGVHAGDGNVAADGIVLILFVNKLSGSFFCEVNSRDKCDRFFVKAAPITKDDKSDALYLGDYEVYPNGETCDEVSCTVFLVYSDYESTSVSVPQGTITWESSHSLEEIWKDLDASTEALPDSPDLPRIGEQTLVDFKVVADEECKLWEWNGTEYVGKGCFQ